MTGIKRLLVPKMLFASLLLSGLLLPMSSFASVRDTISINQGWQFHRGDPTIIPSVPWVLPLIRVPSRSD